MNTINHQYWLMLTCYKTPGNDSGYASAMKGPQGPWINGCCGTHHSTNDFSKGGIHIICLQESPSTSSREFGYNYDSLIAVASVQLKVANINNHLIRSIQQ